MGTRSVVYKEAIGYQGPLAAIFLTSAWSHPPPGNREGSRSRYVVGSLDHEESDMITSGPVISVEAKPSRIAIDLAKTAVLIIDMQNDFGSIGGMFDLAGFDLSPVR